MRSATPRSRHGTAARRAAAAAAVLFVSVALYCVLLWPVPRHFASGIPFGAFATGAVPRALQAGDHLQLLYHFDLMRQWLAGEVPFFSDPWEFNVAGAPPRSVPAPGYAPFSVPYAALVSAGMPEAAAWNFLQFCSVALGLFFCFRLARRSGAGPAGALAAATLATCVPYRWTMLGHGSPTGFAMCFVPAVALGIDVAVRDRRARGGVLAGLALAACWATDLHCFLFAGLALPLWFSASLLRSPSAPFASRRDALRLARALLPAALAAGAVVAFAVLSGGASYAGTDVERGRTMAEIHLHSPEWGALLDPFFNCHAANRFFVGWPLIAAFLLAAAGCAAVVRTGAAARSGTVPSRAPFFGSGRAAAVSALILAAAAVLAAFLALGENGPGDAAALRFLRRAVPPFKMVRQPIKVFCLLPALLSPLFAAAVATPPRRFRSAAACALALFAAASAVHGSRMMHAGLCMLPGPNRAWDAAVADAASRGVEPRALVLPIHDSDQASGSVCQYLAARSRLPVLNGYSAVDDVEYTKRVVRLFDGMSGGGVSPKQAHALRKDGVSHLVLSETGTFGPDDAVFPFASTLRRFVDHPAFRLVASDSGWWTFAFDPGAEIPASPPAPRLPLVEYPARDAAAWIVRPPVGWSKFRVEAPENACGEGFGWVLLGLGENGLDAVSTSESAQGEPPPVAGSVPAERGASAKSGRTAFLPTPAFPGVPVSKAGLEAAGFGRIAFAAWTASGGVVESAGLPGSDPGAFTLDPGLFHHTAGCVMRLGADGTPSGLSFRKWRDSPSFTAATGPGLPLALPPGRYGYRLAFAGEGPREGVCGGAGGDPGLSVHAVSGVSRFKSAGPFSGTFDYDGFSPVEFSLYWSGACDRDLAAVEISTAGGGAGRTPQGK